MSARARSGRVAAPVWPAGAALSPQAFVARVRDEGRSCARDLPWRNLDDAYAVLVSEVMLQQTQVSRVLGRWERFMGRFPTLDALASASASDVLEEWQGLGYNRRALMLRRAAQTCARDCGGALPRSAAELQRLPGIGPATAAGVVAFAYGAPSVYLETNVRAVFIHELFADRDRVSDSEIVPLVRTTCPPAGGDVRGWYYALLDYGAHLKRTVANPSRRSASYARQSAFQGSRRQKRAELVRIVLASGEGVSCAQAHIRLDEFERAHGRTAIERAAFDSIADDLVREGFFVRDGDALRPA